MSHNLKDQINDLGKKVVDNVTHAADWVKEKTGMAPKEGFDAGIAGIKPHMDVIASCGTKVGVVDRVEGGAIKLTRDSCSDGQHHFLPTSMVANVDSHVHLNKNHVDAMAGCKSDAAACGACGG